MQIRDPIFTPRLILRDYSAGDADSLLDMWGDHENGQYMSDPFREDMDEKYISLVRGMTDDPEGIFLTAVLREGGETCGSCCLFPGENDVWDIGYCLDKRIWRRGFGTEMIAAVLDYLRTRGASAVTAEVAVQNAASCALLRKLGFATVKETSFRKSCSGIEYRSVIFRLSVT